MDLLEKVFEGVSLSREDIVYLLDLPCDSNEVKRLGEYARKISKEYGENKGKVWGAIGLDYSNCKMNCSFCSLGEKWNQIDEKYELTDDEILKISNRYIESGVDFFVIRTTEFYDFEKLKEHIKKLKKILPKETLFIVNTGDENSRRAEELNKVGADIIYQAIRLREGVDTNFDLSQREETIKIINNSSCALSQYLEPIGPEHSSEEIADRIIGIIEENTKISGVMKRVSVENTPKFKFGDLSDDRVAQITAILRICLKDKVKDIVIHPYSKKAVDYGANVLVVDIGAIPRSSNVELEEWDLMTVDKAKKLLKESDYDVKSI